MSRQYVLTEQHHLYLNEKAVSLTIILNRPVASRHVLDAIMRLLQLGISIDDNTLRIQVEEKLKTRRDGGKQGKKYRFHQLHFWLWLCNALPQFTRQHRMT